MKFRVLFSIGIGVCLCGILMCSLGDSKGTSSNEDPVTALGRLIPDDQKTQVMVLGSAHLRTIAEKFTPSLVDSLLDVLVYYRPDIIGIEVMPPHILDDMERRGGNYVEVVQHFGKNNLKYGHIAQKRLRIKRIEAERKAAKILSTYVENKDMPVKERMNLVLCMVAAYDLHSALLQWLNLPESIRTKNTVIPGEITSFLDEFSKKSNETVMIGVNLGKKLGLQKIDYIDDHLDKDVYLDFAPELSAKLENNPKYLAVIGSDFYNESNALLAAAVENGDLLSYYRYLNSAEYTKGDVDLQWGAFLRTKLDSGLDRSRLACWDVRNMNMVSHIRRATIMSPGKRMLVIVGVGHKPFFESFLNQMADIHVVDFEQYYKDFTNQDH